MAAVRAGFGTNTGTTADQAGAVMAEPTLTRKVISSRLAGVIRCRVTRMANTREVPMMHNSPAMRYLRRSTISLHAPAGIASKNSGKLVAT